MANRIACYCVGNHRETAFLAVKEETGAATIATTHDTQLFDRALGVFGNIPNRCVIQEPENHRGFFA